MRLDIGRQFKFPEQIMQTQLRLDMIIYSTKTMQVIMLESTVTWDEDMNEAQERKFGKHLQIVWGYKGRGWRAQ